tara:strand:+ start:5767 stop:7059 length:1293 start_codon:yes stop_codon:yes gene_type:complete
MVYLPHWPIPASFGNAKIDYELVFFRIKEILEKLGNPHKTLSPSIHITGTNGKGSTAAFLSQILRDQKYSVNLYSSPHIHHVNERFLLNNTPISDSQLFNIIEEIRIANNNEKITFFEAMTCAAIIAFERNKADFNIFEVGMGARIDATNIIENRAASIITPISFDHEEYLGNNIVNIAFEKAHIIKSNSPLILGPQPQQANEIIELIAKDQNTPTVKYDQDFKIDINEDYSFNFQSSKVNLRNISKPNLEGHHQYINASIAIAASFEIGIEIDKIKISKSPAKTIWRNRLEKINGSLTKTLGEENEIFIDSAHNTGGAYAIANWIEEKKIECPRYRNIAIVGFSRNKCRSEFLKVLNRSFDEIFAIRVEEEPYPEESLKVKQIGEQNNIKVEIAQDLNDAILKIKKISQDKRVVICGSIHLARDLKKYN